MNKKLRFGGVSFGGIVQSVNVFGLKHKVTFGRLTNNKKHYGFTVEEKKFSDKLAQRFFLLFPLFDLIAYSLSLLITRVDFTGFVSERFPVKNMPSVYIPLYIIDIILIGNGIIINETYVFCFRFPYAPVSCK